MYQLATAPRGIGQVLDSIFKLTSAAWLRMLPYAVLGAILSAVPFVYLISTGVLDDPEQFAAVGLSPAYWTLIAVMMPVSVCLYGAGVLRIESIARGSDIGFGASFRAALPRIVAMIIASICFMLAVALGFVLLVIPGIILLCSLFFYLPAIMLDGKGPVESLKFSHKLVWGNWWRVATIGTIAAIIVYVVYLLLGLLFGLFVGFGGSADPATVFIVNMVATLLGGLLITAFFFALYVELYREVKMRKTGGDLAVRIAAAGSAR
ncbi:MAG: hypothetical protein EHM59_16310 [Betaproteobacteria bacterium]|nr:MAG: hypothetical protein EHM59_16310 [Betaproteobacteria bacterium]